MSDKIVATAEKLAAIQKLRPIDDIMFEVLVADKGVCEEILQVILQDKKLRVLEVHPQEQIRNLLGRSVRLDVLCILSTDRVVNIEMQLADNDDHLRRVRYNAACITVDRTDTGTTFTMVADVKIVYISAFDSLQRGRTIYHLQIGIKETGEFLNDGQEIVMVNCSVNDGTDIAELMACFLATNVNHPKFPNVSNRVNFIKNTEKGREYMCEIMDELIKENEEKVRKEEREKAVFRMIKKGFPLSDIADVLDVSIEYIKSILTTSAALK